MSSFCAFFGFVLYHIISGARNTFPDKSPVFLFLDLVKAAIEYGLWLFVSLHVWRGSGMLICGEEVYFCW